MGSQDGEAMSGYAVYEFEIKCLEGKLLTIIEMLGLPESQERATKGMLRQTLWKYLTGCEQIKGEFLSKAIRQTRDCGAGWNSGIKTDFHL